MKQLLDERSDTVTLCRAEYEAAALRVPVDDIAAWLKAGA